MEKINPKEHRVAVLMRRLSILFHCAVVMLCICVLASPFCTPFEFLLALIIGVSLVLYMYIYFKEKKQ